MEVRCGRWRYLKKFRISRRCQSAGSSDFVEKLVGSWVTALSFETETEKREQPGAADDRGSCFVTVSRAPLQRRRALSAEAKLTDTRVKNKLMGVSLDTRGFPTLLPSLDMQLRAYPELRILFFTEPPARPRGSLRCKLLLHQCVQQYAVNLRAWVSAAGCVGLAANGAGARRCTAGLTPASVRTWDRRTAPVPCAPAVADHIRASQV